jgi:pSer/pThr/pTyr-binding forkhead associated (FHA) protein
MVQLRILSGKYAGAVHHLRRFPCLIGRSADAELRLEEPGVWDRHLELRLDARAGFGVRVLPGARAALNGQNLTESPLRNGDTIEAGCVKIQFWLSQPRQRSLLPRERLTWAALGLLCIGQIVIVYRLLP